jgi:hypothetical protein
MRHRDGGAARHRGPGSGDAGRPARLRLRTHCLAHNGCARLACRGPIAGPDALDIDADDVEGDDVAGDDDLEADRHHGRAPGRGAGQDRRQWIEAAGHAQAEAQARP